MTALVRYRIRLVAELNHRVRGFDAGSHGPAKTALFQVWNAVKGYAQEEYEAFMMEAAAADLAAARPTGEA
jgi:hypothetical protein